MDMGSMNEIRHVVTVTWPTVPVSDSLKGILHFFWK